MIQPVLFMQITLLLTMVFYGVCLTVAYSSGNVSSAGLARAKKHFLISCVGSFVMGVVLLIIMDSQQALTS